MEAHRHYDNLSLAVVAAQFGITYGCYQLVANPTLVKRVHTEGLLLLGVLGCLAMYGLFLRLSWHASIARKTAKQLESDPNAPGIAEVYSRVKSGEEVFSKTYTPKGSDRIVGRNQPSIKLIVLLSTLVQSVSLLISALIRV